MSVDVGRKVCPSYEPSHPPISLQALTAPCYLHRAAQWKVSALLGLTLSAHVVAGLAYGAWKCYPRQLGAGEIAFRLFLMRFLVLLKRPSVWRAPVVLAADRQGTFFVHGEESLLVPRHETGPPTIARAPMNEGVSESVIVAIST